jgi:DNA/RNA endonuclease YhcR with UshA esterase domain
VRTILDVVAGAALLVGTAVPVIAHHSFAAEFDVNKPVKIKGKVAKVEWVNPHSWIHIDVTSPDGKVENWAVEGAAPNALIRRGWTKNSLPAGIEITVDGFQAKDGSYRANARDVTFPDGTRLFVGSTGTGAPEKEKEKEKEKDKER